MSSSCIITDSAALLPRKQYSTTGTVVKIPYSVSINGEQIDIDQIKNAQLPTWIPSSIPPVLHQPDEEELAAFLSSFQQQYNDIFLIVTSANLFPVYPILDRIATKHFGRAKLHLFDSQSISIGEGILVQRTSEMIQKKLSADRIEEELRQIIPHIFTLLSTPNFSYLNKNGFIDRGQSIAGEMLGVLPVLSLDNGKVNPLEKFKTLRSLMDYYIEFIDEFDEIETISVLFPEGNSQHEFRIIKQYIEEEHPASKYQEYAINPFLAALIGPQGMGLIIQEKTD